MEFVWAAAVTLVPAVLVLAFRKPAVARAMTILTVVGAAAAIRVGHAGGQLVYVHNAGAAYASGGTTPTPDTAVPTTGETRRPHASGKHDDAVERDRE
jgi:hypothetical protein